MFDCFSDCFPTDFGRPSLTKDVHPTTIVKFNNKPGGRTGGAVTVAIFISNDEICIKQWWNLYQKMMKFVSKNDEFNANDQEDDSAVTDINGNTVPFRTG